MDEYISRKEAIAYIREQSEECQKAFEELGGESGIYADAYNDLAEDFYSIPAADAAPVVHGRWVLHYTAIGAPYTECSRCCTDIAAPMVGGGLLKLDMREMPYCPICGAQMDGGANE